MEWLDRHHVAVVRTATGVVLVASAITGVVGSMTFHDLAKDNAAKQAQIDALAHQLQGHAPTVSPSAPAEAGPTGGTKVVQQPHTSPSPSASVLLLANAQNAPVVPVQGGSQGQGGTTAVPLGGGGSTGRQGGGTTPPASGGGHHTPTPHPSHTPTPAPSPSATHDPVTSLTVGLSASLKTATAPLNPRPQPSQKPLAVLYLIPVTRRNS